MEILNWLGFAMLPIGIIISILLILLGTIKEVKFINPRVPLGRLHFFLGSGFSFVVGVISVNVNIRMYNFDDVQCTVIPSAAYGFVTGMNLQLC